MTTQRCRISLASVLPCLGVTAVGKPRGETVTRVDQAVILLQANGESALTAIRGLDGRYARKRGCSCHCRGIPAPLKVIPEVAQRPSGIHHLAS